MLSDEYHGNENEKYPSVKSNGINTVIEKSKAREWDKIIVEYSFVSKIGEKILKTIEMFTNIQIVHLSDHANWIYHYTWVCVVWDDRMNVLVLFSENR